MRLEGKTVLVTGGTNGIGLCLAQALSQRGARVAVCGRSREKLEALRAEHPDWECLEADVGREADRVRLAGEVREKLGGLDVLVNNAGVQTLMDYRQPPAWEVVAEEIAVNLAAPLHLTQLLLPGLLGRGEAAVVNVTSALALVPKRSAPVYCATKAGLRSFTQALRYQLEGTSVRVMEVLPPLVDTAMTAGRGRGKLTPQAVAEDVVRGLEQGRDELRVGKTKVLFALHRLSPGLAARVLRNS